MFNAGRFDRMPLNRRAAGGDSVRLVVLIQGAWRAMVGSGENIHGEALLRAVCGGWAQAGAGTAASGHMAAGIGMRAEGKTMLPARITAAATFGGEGRLVSQTWLAGGWQARFGGAAYYGGDALVRAAFAASVAHQGACGAAYGLRGVLLGALFDAQARSRSSETTQAVFDIEIAPGETFVVDSGAYTAFLGEKNVIDKQKGAWLLLNRDIVEIRVESDAGRASDLALEMDYMERWL